MASQPLDRRSDRDTEEEHYFTSTNNVSHERSVPVVASSSSSLGHSVASSVSRATTTASGNLSGGDGDSSEEQREGVKQEQQPQQQRRRRRGKNANRGAARSKGMNNERNLLRRYLKEYRDLVLQRCREPSSRRGNNRPPNDLLIMDSKDPIAIGKCEFPRFDDPILRDADDDPVFPHHLPYLATPKGLSPAMRAAIHDHCMELGLFHCGVGEVGERFVAVSVFRDGLTYVPGIDDNPVVLLEIYKPWIRRNGLVLDSAGGLGTDDDKRANPLTDGTPKLAKHSASDSTMTTKQATKEGKRKIMELVDQPSMCWRDGIDSIDLVEMKDEDLADTVPPESDDSNWMWVFTADHMKACIQELEENKPTELAFDLEGYCKSKDLQLTCLIQLATSDGREYVIDVLADGVWDCVGGLAKIFADPTVVKIGHGIGGLDVQSLHRDFGIFVINAFDTHEAAKSLRLRDKGLAKICLHYGMPFGSTYESLKAEYQNCDWTRRPLTASMIQYGRYDVRYLPKIRLLMIRDLVLLDQSPPSASQDASALRDMLKAFNDEDGIDDVDHDDNFVNGNEAKSPPGRDRLDEDDGSVAEVVFLDAKDLRMQLTLMQVISTSQDRCSELWCDTQDSHMKNSFFLSLTAKAQVNGEDWTQAQFELYERLAQWREVVAEAEECLPGFVCQCDFLAVIANYRPGTEGALRRLRWDLPRLLIRNNGKHLKSLLSLVQQSRDADHLEDETELPSYDDYREGLEKKTVKSFILNMSDWGTNWMTMAVVVMCAVAIAVRVTLPHSTPRKND
jgi:ribonuclease D